MSSSSDDVMITCFDVRSEKFMSFIKVHEKIQLQTSSPVGECSFRVHHLCWSDWFK
ncbi:unnamed protein product [Brassica napus]|uniref:(rape) hypothetical protein n=1 Tax=Brassica napus TaxID=3708 RepID=A0A816JTG6_BRANA|nr:unnamed protein product [Brassica napus]